MKEIAAGDYDFTLNLDPKGWFAREDYELRYLKKPELAAHTLRLYRKIFAALREANIACVVFETGRRTNFNT